MAVYKSKEGDIYLGDLKTIVEGKFYLDRWTGKMVRGQFNLETIPFQSDSLFWLNGEIVTVGESKYFKDQISGKNFLITGYDFNADWDSGFPYKSAATISAPADDAVLIAADVNNFLYDSEGDPNQIPVVSLFQDVDYEHKLFCRHAAQVLDLNGVETYEPRVLDVVLYSDAKETTELATLQTYFEVPTEDTTAKWVSLTGNDTTGNGSKESPWRTMIKAEASITNDINQVVYIKTGVYDENPNWLLLDKNAKWYGIGFNTLKTDGTSYVLVLRSTKVCEFHNFIIDQQTTTTTVGAIFYAPSENKLIQRCCFKNIKTNAVTIGGINCKLKYCVISMASGVMTDFNKSVEFDTCYLKGNLIIQYRSSIDSTLVLKHNKISKATSGSFSFTATILNTEIKDNKINDVKINYGSGTGLINFSKNIFKNSELDVYQINLASSVAGYDFTFNDNRIDSNSSINNIILVGVNKVSILRNLVYLNVESCEFISIEPSIECTEVNVNYNTVNKLIADDGYGIKIGNETTNANDNKILVCNLIGNKVNCVDYFNPGTVNTIHGIFVGHQKDAVIKYNKVRGAALGIAVKGETSSYYTDGFIAYNVISECITYGIVSKGIGGVKIYNNTVLQNELTGSTSSALYFLSSTTTPAHHAIDCIAKNNILILTNNANSYPRVIRFGNSDNYSGFVSNYNILFSSLASMVFNGTADKTFAQWQADEHDANSLNQDVEFTNENYLTTNDGVSDGEDLGENYKDGLDASTDWGDDDTLPVIVTKEQGAAWDIGAYVH